MPECGLRLAFGSIQITDETLVLHTVTFVHMYTMNTPNSLLNFNIVPLKPHVSQRSCSTVQFQLPLRDSISPSKEIMLNLMGRNVMEGDVRLKVYLMSETVPL
jgi:hypothetical protein